MVGDSTSGRYSSSRVDRIAESSSFGSLHARVLPEDMDSMLPLGSLFLTLALPRAGVRPAALVFAVESITVAGRQQFAIAVDALPTAQLRGRLLVWTQTPAATCGTYASLGASRPCQWKCQAGWWCRSRPECRAFPLLLLLARQVQRRQRRQQRRMLALEVAREVVLALALALALRPWRL